MKQYNLESMDTNDVRPGHKLAMGFGIVTVRGIKVERDHITFYWEEPQPAVKQHRSNSVERVVGFTREYAEYYGYAKKA